MPNNTGKEIAERPLASKLPPDDRDLPPTLFGKPVTSFPVSVFWQIHLVELNCYGHNELRDSPTLALRTKKDRHPWLIGSVCLF